MNLQIIDYVFLGCALIGLIVGLVKGFLSTLIDLGGIVGGIFVATSFSSIVGGWMSGIIADENIRNIIAIVLCFLVTIIVVSIIGRMLKKLISNVTILKSLDRLLGFAVGGFLVYAVFGILVAVFTIDTDMFVLKDLLPLLEKTLLAEEGIVTTIYKTNWIGDLLLGLFK